LATSSIIRKCYCTIIYHLMITKSGHNNVVKSVLINEYTSVLKNAVFWDVTQCGSYRNRRFGGTYSYLGARNQRPRNL
jgi:hypothetical protein